MDRLIKFDQYCCYGNLSGMFVLNDDEYRKLMKIIDNQESINFGEVLGKHSDVNRPIERNDIKVMSTDQNFIKELTDEVGRNILGYNPLEIFENNSEDDFDD